MGRFFSGVELTLWPKISVILFLALFLVIVFITCGPSSAMRARKNSLIPFDDHDDDNS
jgi:hypothetical protein